MSDAPRRQRLTRSADFDRVYRQGRSYQHRLLVLYRFDRPDDVPGDALGQQSRIGVTVSKRLGNAVERNRLKRQLRDAVERSAIVPVGSCDLVLIARPGLQAAIDSNGFEWLMELVRDLIVRGEPQGAASRARGKQQPQPGAGSAEQPQGHFDESGVSVDAPPLNDPEPADVEA